MLRSRFLIDAQHIKEILEEHFGGDAKLRTKKCLEVGCGQGIKSYILARYFKSYLAIDKNSNNIIFARENTPADIKNITFSCADITSRLQLRDSIDAIIMINSFHFMHFAKVITIITKYMGLRSILIIKEPAIKPECWADDRLNAGSPLFDEALWYKKMERLQRAHTFLINIDADNNLLQCRYYEDSRIYAITRRRSSRN